MPGLDVRPIMDETPIMRPQRWRRMWGATARMALNTPVRLVSMVSLHWAAPMVQMDPRVEMPALATRMSTEPSSARACSTKPTVASRSRTSVTDDTQRRPCSSTSRTVSARSSAVPSG